MPQIDQNAAASPSGENDESLEERSERRAAVSLLARMFDAMPPERACEWVLAAISPSQTTDAEWRVLTHLVEPREMAIAKQTQRTLSEAGRKGAKDLAASLCEPGEAGKTAIKRYLDTLGSPSWRKKATPPDEAPLLMNDQRMRLAAWDFWTLSAMDSAPKDQASAQAFRGLLTAAMEFWIRHEGKATDNIGSWSATIDTANHAARIGLLTAKNAAEWSEAILAPLRAKPRIKSVQMANERLNARTILDAEPGAAELFVALRRACGDEIDVVEWARGLRDEERAPRFEELLSAGLVGEASDEAFLARSELCEAARAIFERRALAKAASDANSDFDARPKATRPRL
jgi:hypothetical protein